MHLPNLLQAELPAGIHRLLGGLHFLLPCGIAAECQMMQVDSRKKTVIRRQVVEGLLTSPWRMARRRRAGQPYRL